MMNTNKPSSPTTLTSRDNSRDDELLDDSCPNPALEVACASCGSMFPDVEKLGRHHCSCIVNKNKADIDDDDDDDDDDDVEDDDDEEEEFDAENFHKEAWLEGGIYELQARAFAEASLSYLEDTQANGKKYELVKLGSSSAASTFCGPLIHANFKAKAKDCPGAPVETFFAQLRQTRVLVVDCCVSLGPSEKLPYWENADLRGCKYCGIPIHHPAENCEKLIKTRHDDVSWLYGDDNVSSSESD